MVEHLNKGITLPITTYIVYTDSRQLSRDKVSLKRPGEEHSEAVLELTQPESGPRSKPETLWKTKTRLNPRE
jgi:hypothetical protein